MLRLLKLLFWIAILCGIVVVGYAYLGDLSPDQNEVTIPLELNAN